MDSPETPIYSPKTPSKTQGENFPKKDNDQSTLHTPNFTPLPTTSDRKPHGETKEPEDNGGNTKPSEGTADSPPTQQRKEQEADARESQPTDSQQTIPQQTGEQGTPAQPEEESLNQALDQAKLLLIEAIRAAVEGSSLENGEKRQFLKQLESLQQEIITNPDGVPLEQLGEKIANIGKNLNSPELQILGLELQKLSLENEEEKQSIQDEINKIAGKDETLKNQLSRLYKLFTGEDLPEEAQVYNIYDIAVAFAEALADENKRAEILDRAKELGFNPESLRQAFDSISQNAAQLQQVINEASVKEKKDPLWKKAAGLGLLGIILFLFVLIRSGLAEERE